MGTQLPSPIGAQPPNFRPMSVVAKRLDACTKMPLGVEVGLGPGDIVFDGDPAIPRKNGIPTPPNFWLMFIVAKRLD